MKFCQLLILQKIKMNESNRRAQTGRSKSSFLFPDREIKSPEKSKKNMDIYTKKVCDFKIKVKLEKDKEGLKKLQKNLNNLSKSNENLLKLQNVIIIISKLIYFL